MLSQRAKLSHWVVAAPNLANHQLLDDSISFETIPRSTSLSFESRVQMTSGHSMRANITEFRSAAGFLDFLMPSDLRSGMPSEEKLTPNTEVQANDKVMRLDAYKLAVLISVAAAILSLCL
jgi:hypothetical protein